LWGPRAFKFSGNTCLSQLVPECSRPLIFSLHQEKSAYSRGGWRGANLDSADFVKLSRVYLLVFWAISDIQFAFFVHTDLYERGFSQLAKAGFACKHGAYRTHSVRQRKHCAEKGQKHNKARQHSIPLSFSDFLYLHTEMCFYCKSNTGTEGAYNKQSADVCSSTMYSVVIRCHNHSNSLLLTVEDKSEYHVLVC